MAIPPRLPNGNGVLKTPRVYSDEGERRRCEHHEADVVIVGAGIAGCALAVTLGKQGRSVLLLERSLKEPDRIVGELLQPGGVRALEKLGLGHCLEDIDAIECHGMDVIYHGTEVPILYPKDEQGAPFKGRSFHHGRFIMRLRESARVTPNVTIVETTAVSVIHSSTDNEVLGVQCTTDGQKDYFFAPLTFIADGYASKFRKQYLPTTPRVKSKFWGLELIDAELPRKNFGHVVLPDGPPVLLYQIGTRETRILVDIPENLPSASVQNGGVKGHLRSVVLPSLPKCVQPSFAKALEKGGLRSMPNSFLPSTTNKTPGLVFLGDSLNMRHPLTGGGMTVAFNDVVLLRTLLSPENVPDFTNKQQVLKQMSKFHWERKGLTSVINILAQALYSLYAANDPYLKALQLGCFRYLQMGLVDGPIALLAGVTPRPWVLLRHFYSVAFLSIWDFARSQPAYMFPVTFFECFIVFWTACRVIFPYIFAEVRS
ncbi:Squalene epoxidase [Blastomyces dermatitidis]|uniref:Squalene monooxygenase n=2 Tax=Ajellomyces dermatitidis TaxID=5039 RepID=F2TIX0_AJEDA|nr:squalene monooxygenase [Blastomyces dermatitidis ER-3]EEQ86021.1 squalene monooxygenase [Blastomyces dermatitidis ER-3]EGE83183.1 squalene monooxygenase [Blastomyces dermatitidis ATCC 18188]EQL29554.1 squalene monooxygenase [Blastomyces dermatitidis ATCC 26199]